MVDIVLCYAGRVYVEEEVFQMENTFISFAAGVAESNNYSVRVFDFYLNPKKYTVDDILKLNPKLILFWTLDSNYEWEPTLNLLRALRNESQNTHIAIWKFNPNANHDLLEEGLIDSIYLGNHGEAKSILKYFEHAINGDINNAPSTVYFQDNVIKTNMPMPLSSLKELNEIPFYKHYQLEDLISEGKAINETLTVIKGSYGCHGRCTFCTVQSFDEFYERYKWRNLEPERVVEEIASAVHKLGAKNFFFTDPLFIGPGKKGKKYAQDIANLIIEKSLDIKFFIYARADTADKETLALLKKAGLVTVVLGVESLSQSQLNRYSKGTKVSKNMEIINVCKELGIYMQPGFILFDAETTIEELYENLTNLKYIIDEKSYYFSKPERLIGGILNAFEGTKVYNTYQENGYLLQDVSFNNSKVEKLGIDRNTKEAYSFIDEKVATIAHACGLVRGEIGRQILLSQKYRKECIAKLKINPNDKKVKDELMKIITWTNYLAKFTIEALEYILDELSESDNHWRKQFEVLDKIWLSFEVYNSKFFGEHRKEIHSMGRYLKIKEKEFQL